MQKLFYHKTDGGAEYLCSKSITGTTEGNLHHAVVRLDGVPELLGIYPAAPKLLKALTWITRCVKMKGPFNTTAYIIGDQYMKQAETAIAEAEGK
jgi:hypothetical protein